MFGEEWAGYRRRKECGRDMSDEEWSINLANEHAVDVNKEVEHQV